MEGGFHGVLCNDKIHSRSYRSVIERQHLGTMIQRFEVIFSQGQRGKKWSGYYHVLIRGIGKQNIFEDGQRFIETISIFDIICMIKCPSKTR